MHFAGSNPATDRKDAQSAEMHLRNLEKHIIKMLFAQREKSYLNYSLFISEATSLFILH